MPQKTNPAAEILKMCKTFDGLRGAHHGGATRDVLASCFGISSNEAAFYSLLAAISVRFDRLISLVDAIPNYPVTHKGTVKHAISNLRTFAFTDKLGQQWEPIRANAFRQDFLNTLHLIEPLVQPIAPISLPTPDERKEIANSISEAIKDLELSPTIMSDALVSALNATLLVLQKLDYFGVDELVDKILSTSAQLRFAEDYTKAHPQSHNSNGLAKAMAALLLIVNAVVISDAAITAVENYYNRIGAIVSFVASEIRTAPKLLPAPQKSDEDSVKELQN